MKQEINPNDIQRAQAFELRPFSPDDASTILSWCKDKHAFRQWSADRYKEFPAQPEEMTQEYEGDNKFPLTAVEGETIIGHILLRYPTEDKTLVRFGFIIVDNTKRGKGYGKQMLRLAIEYAQRELGARRITLGVFCENRSALECYKSVGFRITGEDSYWIDGEEWKGFEMDNVIRHRFLLNIPETCNGLMDALSLQQSFHKTLS